MSGKTPADNDNAPKAALWEVIGPRRVEAGGYVPPHTPPVNRSEFDKTEGTGCRRREKWAPKISGNSSGKTSGNSSGKWAIEMGEKNDALAGKHPKMFGTKR